jgi:hypothetical protein
VCLLWLVTLSGAKGVAMSNLLVCLPWLASTSGARGISISDISMFTLTNCHEWG